MSSAVYAEYKDHKFALPVEQQDKATYDAFDWLHHLFSKGGSSPLSIKEKEFFAKHPIALQRVREIRKYVTIWQNEFCPSTGGDDAGNAVFHYITACYLSFHLGVKTAGEFLFIHENIPRGKEPCFANSTISCWAKESRMDIYNNELGLICGTELKKKFPNEDPYINSKPRAALIANVRSKLERGELSVIGKTHASSCSQYTVRYPNSRHMNVPRSVIEYFPGNLIFLTSKAYEKEIEVAP